MAVDWETCVQVVGCTGVRAPGGGACIAHARRPDLLASIVEQGDFRGVPIDAALMRQILEAAPTDDAGRPYLDEAHFDQAVFEDDADFRSLRFQGYTSFERTEFRARALFDGATFEQVSFESASFGAATSFGGAEFGSAVTFHNAEFHGTVEMGGLELAAGADFSRALFEDTMRLACEVHGELTFRDARFRGLVDLVVDHDEPGAVRLDDVLCEGQIDAALSAAQISIMRSRFDRGGRIVVRRGDLSIEGRMARPMLIAAVGADDAPPPKLLSLTRSDVSGTTLSGFDMTHTEFAGTHGLDGLRLDGPLLLGHAKARIRSETRRRVIADETPARAADRARRPAACAEVAALYRDLRAGQEGRKDEPGSADFYFGEMEMRRLAAPPVSAERAILEAYRITSGYGLRPSRSLGTLAALVIAATIAFQTLLVDDPPRLLRTLLFALRSTVSFVREPTIAGLTLGGEFVQLGLRFAGPVLLALTALAIRARVRR